MIICPLWGILSASIELVAVQLVNTWKQTEPNCQGMQASFMLQCKPMSNPSNWRDGTEHVSWQVSVELDCISHKVGNKKHQQKHKQEDLQ